MATIKKTGGASHRKRAAGKVKGAEFPDLPPAPPLFSPKPLDPAAVRRNAVVRLQDGRTGKIVAIGAHRVRLAWTDGSPSGVVIKGVIESIIAEAPTVKRTGSKAPKSLRIGGRAPVEEISDALVTWADEIDAKARVVEALRDAIMRLEARG